MNLYCKKKSQLMFINLLYMITIIKIPFAYSQWRSNTSEKNPQSLTFTTSKDDFQITLTNFLIQMKFLFGMRKETRFYAVCSSENKIERDEENCQWLMENVRAACKLI